MFCSDRGVHPAQSSEERWRGEEFAACSFNLSLFYGVVTEEGLCPTTGSVLIDALVAAMDSYQAMGKKVFQDKAAMDRFQSLLIDYVYDKVNSQNTGSAKI